ncbi:MAG: hypothetical protein Q9168_005097 [Polycauliona sp. 1 TL-2023]
MAYLQKQISLTSAAGKISNKRFVDPPSKPVASPTPSDISKYDLKRKRVDLPHVPFSQPADTGVGQHIMTQVTYAIDHLKKRDEPQTFAAILEYLSMQTREDSYKNALEKILIRHEKVNYEPKREGQPAVFSFRPVHNIRSADGLLQYLQAQRSAHGLNVKELRDGWPGAEDTISLLEADGKLLVTRNKKDNHARMVWPNDPSLNFEIDDEFKAIWHKIKLPEAGALADELEKEGLTPANKHRLTKKPVKAQPKPKRKARAGGKTTNVHMAGVLKDYSHLKK